MIRSRAGGPEDSTCRLELINLVSYPSIEVIKRECGTNTLFCVNCTSALVEGLLGVVLCLIRFRYTKHQVLMIFAVALHYYSIFLELATNNAKHKLESEHRPPYPPYLGGSCWVSIVNPSCIQGARTANPPKMAASRGTRLACTSSLAVRGGVRCSMYSYPLIVRYSWQLFNRSADSKHPSTAVLRQIC